MFWATPSLSHRCTEATKSVLALCNTEVVSPHLLAIGGGVGNIDVVNLATRVSLAAFVEMHESNVLDVAFHKRDHLLSFDAAAFLHIDLESSNRTEIFDSHTPISAFTFYGEDSPIIAAARDDIFVCDLRARPTPLIAQNNVTEVCLLADQVTLSALQFNSLVITDLRYPAKFHSLSVRESFSKLSCNRHHLAAVSDVPKLFAFEFPLVPESMVELCEYVSPFISRAAFIGGYIAIGDATGSIFVFDPPTQSCDVLPIPLSDSIVSLAGNSSEIAVSLEDDIFVFSHFGCDDNLIRPADGDDFGFEEEDLQTEQWLAQPDAISVESGECTYERYGYCEQQVFVCMTCMRGTPFGVCLQCSQICHADHDVRAIGTRRRFRCDCGNEISHHPCRTMCEPKTYQNVHNRYGHNFSETWCVCDGPDRREEPMVQCNCCSDWFHHRCLGMFTESRCIVIELMPELDDWLFVCSQCCSERLTFLNSLPDGAVPERLADFVDELRRDYELKAEGDPGKDGVGFRILGGRWLPKERFAQFAGVPEFDAEFGALDVAEEDRTLRTSRGQAEFAQLFRDLYTRLFQRMEQSGRRVVQTSDVRDALREELSRTMRQRREQQDQDQDD
jgi:E3 ubiquitin-protein ligase UBR7